MTTPRNIAVFIDFENFGHEDSFDAEAVIERLKEKGRLLIKKAYADWGRFAKYKRMMLENSIELTEMPSHGGRGKNSADIQLVVDALETALTRDYIDTFVVVSGDSDFTPLISKLRMHGKYVIVVGDKRQLSGLIKGYCDELIYYQTLVGGPVREEVKVGDLAPAFQLLARAVALLEKEGQEARGSQAKMIMRQLDPSFDEANFGFPQFRRFLKAAREQGVIRLTEMESGGDVLVASAAGGSATASSGRTERLVRTARHAGDRDGAEASERASGGRGRTRGGRSGRRLGREAADDAAPDESDDTAAERAAPTAEAGERPESLAETLAGAGVAGESPIRETVAGEASVAAPVAKRAVVRRTRIAAKKEAE